MSLNSAYNRSRESGFQPLTHHDGDVTVDIPLEGMDGLMAENGPNGARVNSIEKAALLRSRSPGGGLRRSLPPSSNGRHHIGYDGEADTITKMGLFYNKILNFSIVTRYILYVAPLAIIIAIPIVIGATAAKNAYIGGIAMTWFFVWIEVVWLSLWTSKVFAKLLPLIFASVVGIVSSGVRKYALVLKALEIPLSLVGWALTSLATFKPIMTENPRQRANPRPTQHWVDVIQDILAPLLIATIVFLIERLLVQLLSINYHRKQFAARIKQSKRNVHLLGVLYEASRRMFPVFCPEFAEEDAIISHQINLSFGKDRKQGHARTGSTTPLRFIRNVGRFGDQVGAAFGGFASEIAGKQVLNTDTSYSTVIQALERSRSCEALARRLWLAFVIEGNEKMFIDDLYDVLGQEKRAEADEVFSILDADYNGDIGLDEMIMGISEFSRERKAINTGMHDVDQAIRTLDSLLATVAMIVVVFIFVAFLNKSFVTTLATAGTTLLSLSFVFATSCQEVLGSCIFIFVKHPFDIGDRVDITSSDSQFVVEHISLLYTVFRRVSNQRTVQIPNIVLNTLWIENVTRSKAMKEQLSIFVHFDTTFEDITLLKTEMLKFVQASENTRDFAPDLDIECVSLGELNKLELRIEIVHKSNWHNETVRRARRSKFMCALVLALRKVPIYGPGSGDPALGEAGNPRFTVSLPLDTAEANRAAQAESKDAKRLVPQRSRKAQPQAVSSAVLADTLASPTEARALETLHERDPALDGTRDAGSSRSDGSTGMNRAGTEAGDIEEVRRIMSRQTTNKGRRRSVRHPAGYGASRQDSNGTSESTSTGLERLNTWTARGGLGLPDVSLTAPTPVREEPGFELEAERGFSFEERNFRGPPAPAPAHVPRLALGGGGMQHASTR